MEKQGRRTDLTRAHGGLEIEKDRRRERDTVGVALLERSWWGLLCFFGALDCYEEICLLIVIRLGEGVRERKLCESGKHVYTVLH